MMPLSPLSHIDAQAGPERTPGAAPSPAFAAELSRTDRGRTLVAAQRTPLSGSQAAAAIEEAWTNVVGEQPDESTLAILTAHWAHETGHGKAMLNFNFAGIKGTGPSGLSASYLTREGWGASEVKVDQTFRAYRSAAEGAEDYISLLARRYPDAVAAARSGDSDSFVSALKEGGYFTGNPEAYRRNVSVLSRQALAAGFDAMGTPGAAALTLPEPLPAAGGPGGNRRPGGFPAAGALPFDTRGPGLALAQVDPLALYDAVTRATLRIAGEPNDDSRDGKSST
jgi:hypothetical protein